jgi:hypothetical protein
MRLARLFLCVFALCMVLSGSVVLISRMAGPYRISWLDDKTCALPCWRGISPGVTTAAEAERLLLAYADIQGEERPVNTTEFRLYTLNSPRGQITFGLVSERGVVRTIWFYPALGAVDYYFTELVAQLGTPAQIGMDGTDLFVKADIWVQFEESGITANIYQDGSLPAKPATCPRYRAPLLVIGLGSVPMVKQSSLEWRGFDRLYDRLCRYSYR